MSLAERLAGRIRAEGPIGLAEYMAAAAGDPEFGYYRTHAPFGRAGDFVTAPEISQMFGELVGLWCAVGWQQMGEPDPVLVVELGPGRGTLMDDAIRAIAAAPRFRAAMRLHLVETSHALRRIQAEILADRAAVAPVWHDTLDDVPDGPLLLVANEFFDALPIRQFQRGRSGWHERCVDVDDAAGGGRFRFVLSPEPSPAAALLAPELRLAPEGSIAELCPAGIVLARDIGARIARWGGAALIVDYGYASQPGRLAVGDTLQAIRQHRRHDPLATPGAADITAHVDFGRLAAAAGEAGAACHGPIGQGALLTRLGIEARADRLRAHASVSARERIGAALARLIAPQEMGTLFQAMAMSHPRQPAPPGFEA